MNLADVLVVLAGGAFMAWELWYFLAPRKPRDKDELPRTEVQEVRIVVRGGYYPDTVVVETGRPVRLRFYRDETADCSERVIFETLGIDRTLPAFQTTTVEFTPRKPGDYPFRCGESVLRGRIVAQQQTDGGPERGTRGHKRHG